MGLDFILPTNLRQLRRVVLPRPLSPTNISFIDGACTALQILKADNVIHNTKLRVKNKKKQFQKINIDLHNLFIIFCLRQHLLANKIKFLPLKKRWDNNNSDVMCHNVITLVAIIAYLQTFQNVVTEY